METGEAADETKQPLPSKGERIELLRTKTGVRARGTVFYSDQLQILVKWDNGASSTLRVGRRPLPHHRPVARTGACHTGRRAEPTLVVAYEPKADATLCALGREAASGTFKLGEPFPDKAWAETIPKLRALLEQSGGAATPVFALNADANRYARLEASGH